MNRLIALFARAGDGLNLRVVRRSLAYLVIVMLQLFCGQALVQAQQMGSDFDHNSTGFQITGPHNLVRCENCHINGVFKGTPRDCASCHGWSNPRSSVIKSTGHLRTNARCESCHFPSASSFSDVVYSHVGVRANTCNSCHDGRYPNIKTSPSDSTHTTAAASALSCDVCHVVNSFGQRKIPLNHIPTAPGAACGACHVNADFSVMPGIGAIHANAPMTGDCAQCHSAANAQAYAMSTMTPAIVVPPDNHIPMGSLSCEACHVGAGSSINGTSTGGPGQVTDGASFRGSLFSHGTMSTGCATCHGSGATPVFYGVTSILQMPSTNGPSTSAHIPASTNCENCHLASLAAMPAQIAPVATRAANASYFGAAAPTALPSKTAIHAGITSGCTACHDTAAVWMGMELYPANFTNFTGFLSRPVAGGNAPYGFNDAHHPTTGDCAQCHAGLTLNSTVAKPSNHIPTVGTDCSQCHAQVPGSGATDYWTMPSVTSIHAVLPANTDRCGQCHSAANAALYAMPSMVPAIVSPATSPLHITIYPGVQCEDCHVGTNTSMRSLTVTNGARFNNAAFSHKNVPAGSCDTCHGANATVFYGVTPKTNAGLSPTHVPLPATASVTCDTCHTNNVPSTLVPPSGAAGVGATTFAGGKFIHTGVTQACVACHGNDSNFIGPFYGLSNLVTMPTTVTYGALSHIPAGNTCENCHSAPTTLVTTVGQLTSSLFRASPPKTEQIHLNVTGSCNSCHEYPMTWVGMDLYNTLRVSPFTGFQTRPQSTQGTYNAMDVRHPTDGDCSLCHGSIHDFTGPTMPANHIPVAATAACENCHTSSNFGLMPTVDAIHANAPSSTGNCVQCHGSAANQAPYFNTMATMQPKIVMMPVASGGVGGHIDTGTLGCESCHVGSNSSLMTPVVQGMHFSNSAYSHSGMGSKTCADCHGASVSATSFYGVQPKSIGLLVGPHVPTTQACTLCHQGAPSGLVPLSGGGATYTFSGAQFIHTGISNGCAACHDVNSPTYYGLGNLVKMPPTNAAGGTAYHMPTSNVCENCHTVSNTFINPVGTLGNSGFRSPVPTTQQVHAGVTGSCNSCHDTGLVWAGVDVNSPLYRPTKVTPFTGFQTRPVPGGSTYAFDSTQRPHTSTGDCSECHGGFVDFSGPSAPANHIPYASSATCASCHKASGGSDFKTMPALTDIHQNAQSTTTNCAQCHSYAAVQAYTMSTMVPALVGADTNHVDMGTPTIACETCHTASVPYRQGATFAGAYFSHAGATKTCAQCHEAYVTAGTFQGSNGTFRPKTSDLTPPHIFNISDASCEVCHTQGAPAGLVLASGGTGTATFAGASFSHTGISNQCAKCHGDAVVANGTVTGGTFYGITNIIKMQGPQTPGQYGPTVHFPTTLACETCHNTNAVSGLIPANATRAAESSLFGSSPPLGAQIHTGITGTTGGCSNCHESPMQWMGVTAANYRPIMGPTNFTGFQTRPASAGGTPFIYTQDANHPTQAESAECSNCHISTIYFGVPVKSATHIPTASTAACSSCHTNLRNGYLTMPPLPLIHQYAPSQSVGCADCHSSAAVTKFAPEQIVPALRGPTSDHMDMQGTGTTALGCEVCHTNSVPGVGTGSFSNASFSHGTVFTGSCAACHGTVNGNGPASVVSFSTVAGPSYSPVSALSPAKSTSANPNANHIPTTLDCVLCHAVPTALVSLGSTTNATSFAGGKFSHGSMTTGCSQCHLAGTTGAGAAPYKGVAALVQVTLPAPTSLGSSTTHLPSIITCENCHKSPAPSAPLTVATVPAMGSTQFQLTAPSNVDIHANVGSATCNDCHENTKTWLGMGLYPMTTPLTGFQTRPNAVAATTFSVLDTAHQTAAQSGTAQCSGCHSNPADYSSTTKSTNHIPTDANCANCHTNPTTYAVMPAYSLIHANTRTGSLCTDCHSVANALIYNAPATPNAVSTMQPPIKTTATVASHVDTAGQDCKVCHATPTSANGVVTFASASFVHSATGMVSCETCHGTVGSTTVPAFTNMPASLPKIAPSNHVPNPANLSCAACHATPAATVVYSYPYSSPGRTFAGGAFNHLSIKTNCAQCHENSGTPVTYAGIPNIVALSTTSYAAGTPGKHIPLPGVTTCETCHLGSAAGLISTTMPATMPAYGATGFLPNATEPTGVQIHTGLPAGSCAVCHEGGKTWSGIGAGTELTVYKSMPSVSQATFGTQYTGFMNRPSASGGTGHTVLDATHPLSTDSPSDCSGCHGSTQNFSVNSLPTKGHIPYDTARAGCNDCHVLMGNNSNYAAPPPVSNIHTFAVSGTTCATCHSAIAAASFSRAAVPANGSIPASPAYTVVGPSTTHIPLAGTADCGECHVASGTLSTMGNGAKFDGPGYYPVYSHTGITGSATTTPPSTCVSCHQQTPTTNGFPTGALMSLPTTLSTTPGAANHIPYTAAYTTAPDCLVCHKTPTTTYALTAGRNTGYTVGGSGFVVAQDAAGLDAAIHPAGLKACNVCHEKGAQWLGMTQAGYKPTSTALPTPVPATGKYTGFLTRPTTSATAPNPATWTMIDATPHQSDTAECWNCHTTGAAFSGVALPAKHMPIGLISTAASCGTCHTTSGEYEIYAASSVIHSALYGTNNVPALASVAVTATSSLGVRACVACHSNATIAGMTPAVPFAECPSTSPQSTCVVANDFRPLTTTGGSTTLPGGITHVPITNTGTVNLQTKTGAIATKAAGTNTMDCIGCHAVGTSFAGTRMGAVGHQSAMNNFMQCQDCHESGMSWTNVSTSSTTVGTTKYPGFQTRGGGSDHSGNGAKGHDCYPCHSAFKAGNNFATRVKPVMRAAMNPTNRQRPNGSAAQRIAGALGLAVDHQGVQVGRCKDCHDGKLATGMPARHLMVSTSCDNCHRTSAWRPAQFKHDSSSANNCKACHNGISATAKPSGHFMTARSCDVCHRNDAWMPSNYSHLSPAYKPGPGALTCISCHVTNSEQVPHQARGLVRTKPTPLGQ